MHRAFSQSKDTYKLSFQVNYCFIEVFDELFQEEALSIACYEVSSATIEAAPDDKWCLDVYFADDQNWEILRTKLESLATALGANISQVNVEKVIDQDWVASYEKALIPIEIGRFFISAKLQRDLCPVDKVGLFIDATRAFGTGDHATTSSCIESLERLANENFTNILDVGTGTGILALAAKKIWPKATVTGCDIEEVAIEIAKNNAIFNECEVEFYQNTEEEITKQLDKKFDLVLANILANPLIHLAPQIRALAEKEAYLILSGFLKYQQEEVINKYIKLGCELITEIRKDEWVTLIIKVKNNSKK